MNMNQKGFANIVLVVLVVVLISAIGYFIFIKKSVPSTSQQTSDNTVYKTYVNTPYGFEFKYPQDWILDVDNKDFSLYLHDTNESNSILFMEAGLLDFISQSSVEKNAEYMRKRKDNLDTEEISINGGNAFYSVVSWDMGGPPTPNAYLVGRDHIFLMHFSKYDTSNGDGSLVRAEALFKQILSAFKFTADTQASAGSYKLHTEHFYRNEKFGFQVEMPSTWTKYVVREDKDETGTVIWFGLPLEGNKLIGSLSEQENSARVINIAWLDIMPIAYFEAHKDDCEGFDGPCFFPIEITRDSTHVYAWGGPNPHAGWDYCYTAAGTEPYVCKVRNDYWIDGRSIFEKTLKLIP